MIRTVIVPPAEEPLSLPEAKAFLQVGHAAEDDLIEALLAGGRAHIENSLDIALVFQTIEIAISSSEIGPGGYMLRPGPANALVSVTRETEDGAIEDVTSLFEIDGQYLRVQAGESLAAFANDCGLKVRFQTGFGAASDVPDDLQLALRLLIGQSYSNRDGAFDTTAMVTITDLLAPYREVRL
ncbi:MAG: hypothetical protein AAFY34_02035 [Pseudomonadota bacterium]